MPTHYTRERRTGLSSCLVRTTQSRCARQKSSRLLHRVPHAAPAYMRTLADHTQGPRSSFRQGRHAPYTLASSRLHQWHHLPRPPRPIWLESCTQRRERLRQSTEHAHEQHQEGASTWRRELCSVQHPAAKRHQFRLPRQ